MSDVIAGILALVAMMFGLVLLLAFPTMWTWNFLMPDLFNLPTIDLWQAVAINFLSTILFKSVSFNSNNK
jgi:hypothetical protein